MDGLKRGVLQIKDVTEQPQEYPLALIVPNGDGTPIFVDSWALHPDNPEILVGIRGEVEVVVCPAERTVIYHRSVFDVHTREYLVREGHRDQHAVAALQKELHPEPGTGSTPAPTSAADERPAGQYL